MLPLSLLLTLLVLSAPAAAKEAPLRCSISEEEISAPDPALREMTYDVGDGEQKVMVYVEPTVEEMYRNQPLPSTQKVEPKFNGFAGKFINMSNKQVTLYW
jgi:hypothetical protein